ncbi:MAG: hypothetical protein Q8L48_32755 [Archangium sp.]|nr:hypothetical protein [Archangium sp.]
MANTALETAENRRELRPHALALRSATLTRHQEGGLFVLCFISCQRLWGSNGTVVGRAEAVTIHCGSR